MTQEIPKIIKEVGFDFRWSEAKVWALEIEPEKMPISELVWHFDVPFWSLPDGHYNLKPIDVINKPHEHEEEYKRIISADLNYPLDVMFWKNRWLFLDGLHRLAKAKILGQEFVDVRKIPESAIPLIQK
jgi:hypothetical protein